MAKEKSVTGTRVAVSQLIEETAELVREIGENQRILDRIQARVNNQIERVNNKIDSIKQRALAESAPYQKAKDELFDKVFTFAQDYYDELTEKGTKKTVILSTGEMQWRLTPRAVSIENEAAFIKWCKSHRLKQFIRVTEEPDKKEILKAPEVAAGIKGVNIEQKEKFVVKPFEVKIELSRETGKLEKVLPKK